MLEINQKADRLIYGNPKSHVAIVTLWTKASDVAKKLSADDYTVIGQLFSAERGLDPLIRNLLANPQITNIVITGIDYSKSGLVLRDFFERGFYLGKKDITERECWRVDSKFPGYIELDIPENVLNDLRASSAVDWINDMNKFSVSNLKKPEKTRQKMIFPKGEEKIEKKYETEDSAFILRHDSIAGVWLQIIDTILKFGKPGDTHYNSSQLEILNLISVISKEDPNNFHIPEFWDKTRITEYIPRVTQDIKTPSSYTYGSRMRSWFGLDQVQAAIDKLVREPISRAVVINLWDSTKDLTIGGSPCVNHVWLRLREGRLYMTVTIRSNDMFEGYPENAYGLRALQELIRKKVSEKLEKDITLGDLVINSQSAHVYEDCFEKARAIIGKYYHKYVMPSALQWDPRGSFYVEITDEDIVLHHLSKSNEVIGAYSGKSAKELRDKLIRDGVVGNTAHAMYLGIELAKAEYALKSGEEYTQDEEIK
jgi:thymidylate synthase